MCRCSMSPVEEQSLEFEAERKSQHKRLPSGGDGQSARKAVKTLAFVEKYWLPTLDAFRTHSV